MAYSETLYRDGRCEDCHEAEGERMDKDRAVRTLWAWFGNREFSVSDLSGSQLEEMAELIGAFPSRSWVGKRLTGMRGYRCATEPHKGAMLIAIRIAKEINPLPNRYQVQEAADG